MSRKKDSTIIRMAKRSDPYRRLVCDQNGRARFGNVKGMKNAEYNLVSKEDNIVELFSVGHKKKNWRLSWNSNSSLTSQFSTSDHSSSCTEFRIRVLSRNVFSEDCRVDEPISKKTPTTKTKTTTTSTTTTNLHDDGYVVFKSIIPDKLTEQALYTINHALGTNRVISGGVQQGPYVKLDTKYSTDPSLLKLYPERIVREYVDDPEVPTSCQIALRFPESEEQFTKLENDSWHTDGERKSRRHPFTLLVGVCLSDCVSSLNRGTLCVWPRQHLNPRLAERPDIGKPVQVPMRRGDVVLCHSELPHCGAPNRSCDIRYMIYFRVRHRFMKRLLEKSPLDPFADLTLLQRPRFRVLSANDLNVFRRDGVLVVRNVISKEEASVLRGRFVRGVRSLFLSFTYFEDSLVSLTQPTLTTTLLEQQTQVQSLGIDKAPERLDRLSSTHTGVLDVFYSEWKLHLTMTCRRYADAYADLLEHTYGTNRGLYEHPFRRFRCVQILDSHRSDRISRSQFRFQGEAAESDTASGLCT